MSNDAKDAAEYAVASREEFAREERKKHLATQSISSVLSGEFTNAKKQRQETEQRWLDDLRQYRGKYGADEEAAMGTRSKVYVRKTRVKIKTIDSRVSDLLFPAGSEKNWSIGPTPKPMISKEQREEIKAKMLQAAQQLMQQKAMAAQQAPGGAAAGKPPSPMTPPAAAAVQQIEEPDDDVIDGVVKDFVDKAAKKMSTTIDDQLTEARYKETCVRVVHSGHLYGTGVLKGPLVERKVNTRFTKVVEPVIGEDGQPELDEDGKPKQQMRWVSKSQYTVVPFVEYVPLWRFYPDMSVTELEDCQFVYEQHFFNRSRMIELSKRKSFDKEAILAFIEGNPNGSRSQLEHFDTEMRSIGDRTFADNNTGGSYEVLERWGWLTGKQLKEAGYDVAPERCEEAFFSNVWMLWSGQIIKVSLQPIDGTTWPYHLYHFDKDETSIFGEGLASVMRDDQAMLNAAVRLMLDNAAITSGPQLEVITSLLVDKEKTNEIFPWKVWKRTNEHMNVQAVRAIELPNNLDSLSKLAAMFESNTDEVTAIPRYMSGENATQGAAGTAAGMSMLMAAANIVIKDLITAWDEGITRSFLQALYHWNMKFNPDDSIKGDFDVKARGTASLIAKEVRARQLNEFAQLTANPDDKPYIKRHDMLLQRAEANEMTDVVMSKEEFAEYQKSPEFQAQQELMRGMAEAQLGELRAKIASMTAQAELNGAKAKEAMESLQMVALEAKKMLADTEQTKAETVRILAEAVFASLQAGGVAVANPFTAPAGDEIYRSVGGVDKTPARQLDDLNRRPIQESDGTVQVLNKGARFEAQPRVNGPTTVEEPEVDQPETPPPEGQTPPPELQTATGLVGKGRGIETTRIEGAPQ